MLQSCSTSTQNPKDMKVAKLEDEIIGTLILSKEPPVPPPPPPPGEDDEDKDSGN